MEIIDKVVDFLLPSVCIFCKRVGDYVCKPCIRERLIFKENQVCHVCKNQLIVESRGLVHDDCKDKTSLDGVVVCLDYNDSVERIISEIKYKLYFRTVEFLDNLFLNYISYLNGVDILVPVPLHRKKLWERGFNQAELITKRVSEQINITYKNLIKRTRNTKTQVGMSRKERIKNLKDVFELDKKWFKHRDLNQQFTKIYTVCLVDDVMTTGTTLEESAKVLKSAGVKQVFGIVLARG